MINSKEELRRALAAAPKRSVQIGETIHIHIGDDDGRLELAIKRALDRGVSVTENDIVRWIVASEIVDTSKSGSAAYQWRGDKVKVELTMHRLDRKTGKQTQERIGTGWRAL